VPAALARHYYEPLGKQVEVERWEAVEGAGEVEVGEGAELGAAVPEEQATPSVGPAIPG
jgi:hypothetical protein